MSRFPADVTRRNFLRTTSAAATAAATARAADDDAVPMPAMPRAPLGRTGVEVSRLGIGCAYFMRQRVTPEDCRKTLLRAVELGVTYLDTAPSYGTDDGGFAEEKMGAVIPEIRDRVFLVTKTHKPTYEGTWELLRQSLKRMRTERLDLVHLHNFGDMNWWGDHDRVFGDHGPMQALREAKKDGILRFIGASGHLHPAKFHEAIDSGEIDVLMNAVNFVVRHTYDFEHKVWTRARREKLGLVAMKVLGGMPGGNPNEPSAFLMPDEHYDAAVRYALGAADVAVIGLENIAELERAARAVASSRPLTDDESHDLARIGLDLAATKDWREVYGGPLT